MLFKIKHPNLAKITFIFLSLLASVSICISMASKNIYPTILNMACSQTSKLASLITSKAIKNQINNDLNIDELIQVSYKEDQTTDSVIFDTFSINDLLSSIILDIYSSLKAIESGQIETLEEELLKDYDTQLLKKGIIYEIPFGLVYNNQFLVKFGPKMPVKFQLIGDVTSNIYSNINQYGINNALIEINAIITINIQVIVPMATTRYDNVYQLPIALKAIQGDIPLYYQGNNSLDNYQDKFVIPLN